MNNLKRLFVFFFILYANFLVFVVHPQQALASPLPLGSAQTVSNFKNCPSGASCTSLQIACPDLSQNGTVILAEYDTTVARRGVVILLSGGGGTSWYDNDQYSDGVVTSLVSNGFKVISGSWKQPWEHSASGEKVGIAKLACRPATMIKWVYDNKYVPLGITLDKVGKCGFCVSGNSGGSTQTIYSIGYYGLDTYINAVVPSSGPPHSAQTKGCLNTTTAYAYDAQSYPNLDGNYGYSNGGGPCEKKLSSWTPNWDADSISIGANDYVHPTTRIQFLTGEKDPRMQAHAGDYYNKLLSSGTPYVNFKVVAGVGHEMPGSADGSAQILAALLADTGVSTGGSGGSSGGGDSGSGGGSGSSGGGTSTGGDTTGDGSTGGATGSNPAPSTTIAVPAVPKVQSVGDVPGAVLNALTSPTDLVQVAKSPYGWIILLITIVVLVGLGTGGFLLYRKHKHLIPEKWHFVQKPSSKPIDPTNSMSTEIIHPTENIDEAKKPKKS